MEAESESYEQVNVKKEPEVAANGAGDNLGPFNGNLHRLTNGFRLASMATSGPNTAISTPEQLTIFYGGTVLVFDGIPTEKASEIMLIASKAAVKSAEMKKSATGPPASNTPILTRSPSMQSTSSALPSSQAPLYPAHQGFSFCKLQAELPITRRHSLQRFFEKRRDRLCSKSPYASPAEKTSEPQKANGNAEASPNGGCIAPGQEIEPKCATTNRS
ncbi:protein TIFY 3B-like [Mercurialis annua]|uniref:protein TIFY 3B-like n=1 Tax=Mercurialis annua TaxID=3986 RepID=UPI00215FE91B|nr:protein TIFY 3B-like [Mercurialis annua]